MKNIKLFCLTFFAVFILASCENTTPMHSQPLDASTLRALHEAYGFSDAHNLDMYLPQSIAEVENKAAIVKFTVSGDWFSREFDVSPVDTEVSWASSTSVGWYLPVEVDEVLWADAGFTAESELNLYFFTHFSFTDHAAFEVGKQYVCILMYSPAEIEYAEGVDNVYDGTPYACFYVVDGNDVATYTAADIEPEAEFLLTMTELEGFTTPYDGFSLDQFRAEVQELP